MSLFKCLYEQLRELKYFDPGRTFSPVPVPVTASAMMPLVFIPGDFQFLVSTSTSMAMSMNSNVSSSSSPGNGTGFLYSVRETVGDGREGLPVDGVLSLEQLRSGLVEELVCLLDQLEAIHGSSDNSRTYAVIEPVVAIPCRSWCWMWWQTALFRAKLFKKQKLMKEGETEEACRTDDSWVDALEALTWRAVELSFPTPAHARWLTTATPLQQVDVDAVYLYGKYMLQFRFSYEKRKILEFLQKFRWTRKNRKGPCNAILDQFLKRKMHHDSTTMTTQQQEIAVLQWVYEMNSGNFSKIMFVLFRDSPWLDIFNQKIPDMRFDMSYETTLRSSLAMLVPVIGTASTAAASSSTVAAAGSQGHPLRSLVKSTVLQRRAWRELATRHVVYRGLFDTIQNKWLVRLNPSYDVELYLETVCMMLRHQPVGKVPVGFYFFEKLVRAWEWVCATGIVFRGFVELCHMVMQKILHWEAAEAEASEAASPLPSPDRQEEDNSSNAQKAQGERNASNSRWMELVLKSAALAREEHALLTRGMGGADAAGGSPERKRRKKAPAAAVATSPSSSQDRAADPARPLPSQ